MGSPAVLVQFGADAAAPRDGGLRRIWRDLAAGRLRSTLLLGADGMGPPAALVQFGVDAAAPRDGGLRRCVMVACGGPGVGRTA